ncbi:unnamed protein product [Durusdinium trenchii]|uniref:C3H1-type domain-containing protein n=2 Tax=Durusdinium trenchii TaxID=1381693 RepID=A0ABP0RLA2_9DINO
MDEEDSETLSPSLSPLGSEFEHIRRGRRPGAERPTGSFSGTSSGTPSGSSGEVSDPCVFFASDYGCSRGNQCGFCHRGHVRDDFMRPPKEKRRRMKQKIWQIVSQRNLDVEAIQPELQQLAQQHPYMRQLIQGFLDNLAQQRGCARIEGVVFSV